MAYNKELYEQRKKRAMPDFVRNYLNIQSYVRKNKSYMPVPTELKKQGYGWQDVLNYYDLKYKEYYGLPINVKITTSQFGITKQFENNLLTKINYKPVNLPRSIEPKKEVLKKIIIKNDKKLIVEQELKGTFKDIPKFKGLPSERVLNQQQQLLFAKLGATNNIKQLKQMKNQGIETIKVNGKNIDIDKAMQDAQNQKFNIDALSRGSLKLTNKGIEIKNGAMVGKDEKVEYEPAVVNRIRDLSIDDYVAGVSDSYLNTFDYIKDLKNLAGTKGTEIFENSLKNLQVPLIAIGVEEVAMNIKEIGVPVAISVGVFATGMAIADASNIMANMNQEINKGVNIPSLMNIQAISTGAVVNFPNANPQEFVIDDSLFANLPVVAFPSVNTGSVVSFPSINENNFVSDFPNVYDNSFNKNFVSQYPNINAYNFGIGTGFAFNFNYAYDYGYNFNFPTLPSFNFSGLNFNFPSFNTNNRYTDLNKIGSGFSDLGNIGNIQSYVPDLTALTFNLTSKDMNIKMPSFSGLEFRDIKI